MKKIINQIFLISSIFLFAGCDKDFVEVNTNPYAITSVEPQLLFAGAQRSFVGAGWETENTIVQQFVNPFDAGATKGPNFNADIDNFNNARWENTYVGTAPLNNPTTGGVKSLIQALYVIGDNPKLTNLKSMIRIWKAYGFMELTDTYGDVPYFDAGKAYTENIPYPKYDDDAAIYADLEKELKEATAALSPAGDYVSADLFFGSHAVIPITNATDQVAKWKKLGYSILLRLGMRYSKINPAKAQALAAEAFAGGVMTSNADNVFVKYDGTIATNVPNVNLVNNNPRFYYAAEPFVNQLKNTNDPRSPFIVAKFADPSNPLADPNPDLTIASQFGVPVGVISDALSNPPYRGTRGGGYNYSQLNVKTVASQTAPTFWVTYGQTSLLLAEAAKMGWIPGGDAAAKTYYEAGITANMDTYALYPNGGTISGVAKAAYLADPAVLYNPADALRLINTQYWIVNIANGTEAWANFRRSGFPVLSPNLYNNNLSGGFIRRLSYPDYESSNNRANYTAAVQAIGGTDNLTTRVFWDKP
ncbi:SusD/RagB family nutrient-binding outer membrane lipoprotein [Ferruginibacter sp. HRS2-29]|uniref:SusD/RagB family nutrient-binding outer membrane lipoprotein n=1 Tax=Ferruginibacter sp. HRS2-29 TaxID=2487334 RepID=UPI0020CC5881|nr:SusD/RagB family nutrient-binding outer membrane lipoprotein [Ferruginibacter sp. HRS2-29]MCP9753446.1 SusD/RagB family nutrient-binding outer membrane lipoprotein [Ferruginibacter sp. HRS2-29]